MTRTTKTTSRRLAAKTAAATVTLCLATGVGGAYAYWATVGAGSGAATNGTMATVTVEALVAGDSPQNTLAPGGTADVAVRAHNPNGYAVRVYAIRGDGAATAVGDPTGCPATGTGVTFVDPAAPLAPTVSIPANSSVLITLQGAAAMSTASLSGCQGATFSLPVTLEARK
ncbi:hypothetical protein [Pseudarthrobacter raffinosi]|uniref:hypothetical protein n=1 Tax=Pseudarthrobacter raffinosi TaxID=2953651 RepID=UPI00208EDBAE|nr:MULTISPECIES: hypothetical protein [unclassified Pseudarthrobacter]MCO4238047.1 hypothetical protein [Pseudarthrobacter sp. MDT3-28]MCO4251633.1 hypothetical protein [Pseudarthrobacter sp. MDT3-9]MCO4264518.1 hypothetical protein [Pseudarthrobacter sp. MDT3-26]